MSSRGRSNKKAKKSSLKTMNGVEKDDDNDDNDNDSHNVMNGSKGSPSVEESRKKFRGEAPPTEFPTAKQEADSGAVLEEKRQNLAVYCNALDFSYTTYSYEKKQVLHNVCLELPHGSRCLLVGNNGAGKSTLLKILAGRHLTPEGSVYTMGNKSFFQTEGLSGVTFLGGEWTRTVAFAGGNVPYQADIPVKELRESLQDQYPERRDRLYEVLEIDPEWRMHEVSDGQRRRVQIMLGLLRPFKLLLIDEMTVDLDVLARRNFLRYLRDECQDATILYATHIFDGMDSERWATHVAYIEEGHMLGVKKYEDVVPVGYSLYWHVTEFLEAWQPYRVKRAQERKEKLRKEKEEEDQKEVSPFADRGVSGFGSGRMAAYLGT